eukprot:scaffold4346_cov78-Phaeocystis_antarctica.AAC.1
MAASESSICQTHRKQRKVNIRRAVQGRLPHGAWHGASPRELDLLGLADLCFESESTFVSEHVCVWRVSATDGTATERSGGFLRSVGKIDHLVASAWGLVDSVANMVDDRLRKLLHLS